ncbi:hypothetical protein HMPREF9371_0386 [Neisseria shayeganii 871]|uniref:Uncharacterized protein n=1 Tax=Neisseria shayeganii 871 TaxID=1032488 RepID=G4CFJ7_9NEIS|nr:hypothetical protein HMPREF9371_0386 [Neisseria shayeganii 871]
MANRLRKVYTQSNLYAKISAAFGMPILPGAAQPARLNPELKEIER